MNILHRYTRRMLRLNKTRTLVTIIGILLSVALITAVAEGAWSGLTYLRRSTEETVGSFGAYYCGMTPEQTADVFADPEVSRAVYWDELGYAEIQSGIEEKPYLYLVSADAQLQELVPIRVTEGRMPERAGELLLPENLNAYNVSRDGSVPYAVGDTLTLEVGRRELRGEARGRTDEYSPDDPEQLVNTQTRTYTVVGFYKRLDYLLEPYSAPGYTAITTGETGGAQTVFFSLRHPGQTIRYTDANPRSGEFYLNTDLLYYYGDSTNPYITATLSGLLAILIGLIMFGSIALIYNSFSISVSERTKQFGLLKSIGATNRQIRRSVLYEALVLCVIAIPAGLLVGVGGIGVTLYLLRGTFSTIFGFETSVQMGIALNFWVLLFAAAIGLLTAIISAWIPAKRAVRITAIEAIRQSTDVRVRAKQVKTARLTYRLFGFPGMLASKNFKRSRKKYRATVVSLFLSVVLFISAASFCSYLTASVEAGIDDYGFDLSYGLTPNSIADADALKAKLAAAEGVTDAAWFDMIPFDADVEGGLCTDTFRNKVAFVQDGSCNVYGRLLFVEDGVFRALLAKNQLDPADYFNAGAPLALLCDRGSTAIVQAERGTQYLPYTTFRSGAAPFALRTTDVAQLDGYHLVEVTSDPETSEARYRYLRIGVDSETAQPDDYLTRTAAEVETTRSLQIGAQLREAPFFVEEGVSVLYPYSLLPQVLGGHDVTEYGSSPAIRFRSSNHSVTYTQMQSILQDAGLSDSRLFNIAAAHDQERGIVTVVRVFSYGFIVLISLIAAANVFNTISTNVSLRRREMAMLKSVGMSRGGFNRMMNYECLLYGCKGLLWGLPAAFGVTYLIYRAVASTVLTAFTVPWGSVAIAVGSVFAVVFATMLFSMDKIKKDNPIDALKNENL